MPRMPTNKPSVRVDVRVAALRFYLRFGRVGRFCRQVIAQAWRTAGEAEVSVLLTDDAAIRLLNKAYRGADKPTNVLSFENKAHPPRGQPWLAGDIVIAYQTLMREARAEKKTARAHLAHLLIHGALHLQGHDHLTDRQALRMEARERALMRRLGYPDPYAAESSRR